MKTVRAGLIVLVAVAAVCAGVGAEELGSGFGLEFGAGLAGSLSYFEAGMVLPKIRDKVFVDVKARAMSSITWATFRHMETGETVSFHPVVVGGIVSTGTVGPMIADIFRVFGGFDTFFGYSFTPYDSLIYGTANLIPPNLTFGGWGYLGLEFFISSRSSVFIQSGGGFKTLLVDDNTNPYAVASSWLGSGFGIQVGTTVYF